MSLGLGLFLGLAMGCRLGLPDPLIDEPTVLYEFAHERWTNELHIVRQFETQVIVKATLITPEMAQAQALTISRARFEDEATYAARLAAAQKRANEEWTVVFSANAPPPRYADSFALDDSADWQLHLEADGRRVQPIELERIWEPSADETILYTQLDRWSKLYRARFAKPADADSVDLFVVGPYGNGKITWSLRTR